MKHVFDYIKKFKFLILIVTPAFLLYMLVIFPSGTFLCFKDACGINFWGVHGHDGIWHLAIANVSFSKFPFIAPTFSGQNLYGYNYLLDFFIFILSRVGVPAIISYFKLLPIVWFVIFTILLVIFARKIKDSPVFVGIFLFLNYFAGSFSYLLTLYHDKTINGSSTLLPLPTMHMMSNLPYAFSLLPFIAILILIKDRNIDLKKTILIGVCITLVLGLKFYGGVITIFLVIAYLIFTFFPRHFVKLSTYLFIICLFVAGGVFIFYDPLRSLKTGSIFGFAPFALVHTITEEPNLFYLQHITDARYYLMANGGIGPRLLGIEFLNLTLFLFFYLGTRFLSFFYILLLGLRQRLTKYDWSILLTVLFSITLTATLVQKEEWWNTIQFFFYAIFLLTIYLSLFIYKLLKKKHIIATFLGVVILLLSIPPSIDLVRLFAAVPGATYLSVDEMNALEFLGKQPSGVVLTSLYDKERKNYQKSNKLYTYADTAYVAAFSGKQEYYSDTLQLRITGINFADRLARLEKLDCTILQEVDYIYEIRHLLDEDKILVKCRSENVKKIFENKSINIYSITK